MLGKGLESLIPPKKGGDDKNGQGGPSAPLPSPVNDASQNAPGDFAPADLSIPEIEAPAPEPEPAAAPPPPPGSRRDLPVPLFGGAHISAASARAYSAGSRTSAFKTAIVLRGSGYETRGCGGQDFPY